MLNIFGSGVPWKLLIIIGNFYLLMMYDVLNSGFDDHKTCIIDDCYEEQL